MKLYKITIVVKLYRVYYVLSLFSLNYHILFYKDKNDIEI